MYIIIAGCGRLGSNLAKKLADAGHDVCVFDREGDKLSNLGSGFNGKRMKGIEYDNDNLLEGGIETADVLLAVTPDDNINLTVCMIASQIYHVPSIIGRVNNPAKTYLYDALDITTINPVETEIAIVQSLIVNKEMKL